MKMTFQSSTVEASASGSITKALLPEYGWRWDKYQTRADAEGMHPSPYTGHFPKVRTKTLIPVGSGTVRFIPARKAVRIIASFAMTTWNTPDAAAKAIAEQRGWRKAALRNLVRSVFAEHPYWSSGGKQYVRNAGL